jgi:hypothetical protein
VGRNSFKIDQVFRFGFLVVPLLILHPSHRDPPPVQVCSGLAFGVGRIHPTSTISLTPIALTLGIWATILPAARGDEGMVPIITPSLAQPELSQDHPDLLPGSAAIAPPENQPPAFALPCAEILEPPSRFSARPSAVQTQKLLTTSDLQVPRTINHELGEIKLLPTSAEGLSSETLAVPIKDSLDSNPIPGQPGQESPVGSIPVDDPELGEIRFRPSPDDELGTIRERPKIKVAKAQTKSVYLQAHADYFTTSNAFSAKDKISDGFSRTGLTLFYAPPLGPKTYLITSADVNVVRYGTVTELNYNEIRFRAGVSQQLSPTMSAELGWSHQQLFATESGFKGIFRGNRYLKDNSLRFELSRRDTLNPRLSLFTFYQLRRSFTDRPDSDRLSHTFYSSLGYKLNPRVDLALDYQYNLSKYLRQDRRDHFNQVLGRVSWKTTQSLQTNFFVGYSFGFSSEDRTQFGRRGNAAIDFNGWLLGVNLVVNTPLF